MGERRRPKLKILSCFGKMEGFKRNDRFDLNLVIVLIVHIKS